MTGAPRRGSLRRDDGRLYWALLVLASYLIAAIPILTTRIPPIGDYIGHLARIYVIDQGGRDPLIDTFYEVDWQVIPNLAVDLVVTPLAKLVDLYTAGRIYLLLYLGLTVTGVHALHHALYRRWSVGPIAAISVFYNQIHLFGLINYFFGIGVALWGVAAFLWLREAPAWRRLPVHLAFVAVLFFCHLFALGLYGMAVLAIELAWMFAARPSLRDILRELGTAGAAFLPVPALFALSPTAEFAATTWWTFASKPQGFLLALKTYNTGLDMAAVAVAMAGALWAWRRGILKVHPAGWALVLVAAPIYLAMPSTLLSATLVDARLPIAVLLLFIGFLDWRFASGTQQLVFVAVVLLVGCVRVAVVEAAWRELGRTNAEIGRSMEAIPRGSKILVAVADHPKGKYALNEALQEMPARAIIERSSFVSAEFTHPGQQVLRARPAVSDLAADFVLPPRTTELVSRSPGDSDRARLFRKIYWKDWDTRFDFVYLLLADAATPNPSPGHLETVYSGERFQLYRVVHR